MILHETCTQLNDITVNSPISGPASIRKSIEGTWTRTIITTECTAGGTGGGMSYGSGGSGRGVLVKKMKSADGGGTSRPEQEILVFTGNKKE
jgi:hypothetical protein